MALARHFLRLPDNVRSRAPFLKRLSQRIRSRHLFMMDVVGLIVAVIIALAVWRDRVPGPDTLGAFLWIAGLIVATRVAINVLLGLYSSSWRFASVGDMGRILACTVAGTAVAATIVLVIMSFGPPVAAGMPPASFWLLEMTLALVVVATPRFLIRAASDLSGRADEASGHERTLLYGAGWAGVIIARSADRSPETGVIPVGFLDDDPGLKGRRVGGLLVFGDASTLARAKRRTGATSLLITMPRASGASVRRVVEAAMAHGLVVRTVPAVTDLIDGTIDATRIRRVRVEDLLRRPSAKDHAPALRELLHGQTVMITGAAGSIGSELVRQVLALDPGRVVMVDQSESDMYMCLRDLETRSQVQEGRTSITTHLVDVTDRSAMSRLMRETRPVVVLHAAAYKHVPMLEEHVSQAVRVNIGGTMSVVDAAISCGVERFVLVSTDKAVRPSSVMGASKRVAEMVVSEAARRTGKAYVSVRFGNVLGSNGSVIPVFQSQLENGKPLTITDPEMTRYFMTIPEAAWLILDASALSESGSLYVLDMGEPIRVMDVAKDLIRLSGRDPESVPIKVIGLRPGEKVHEQLFYDHEDVTPTEVPKVLRSTSTVVPEAVRDDVDRLLTFARDGRDDELRVGLHRYVRVCAEADEAPSRAMTGVFDWVGLPPAEEAYRPVVLVPVHTNGNVPGANGVTAAVSGNGSAPPVTGNGASPVRNGTRRTTRAVADADDGLLEKKTTIRTTQIVRASQDGKAAAPAGHLGPAEVDEE